jgi:hypothetical protein
MKNSVEQICNMITVNEVKYNPKFYQKSTKLLNDILQVLIKDSKLASENMAGLRKMTIIAKKLIDVPFCKDKEIKFNLLNFLKLIMLMMRDLYEKGVKDQKILKHKEYIDFVRNTIVNKYLIFY